MKPISRIIIDPKVLAGKPIIAGTRVSVQLILNLISNGYDFDRILQAYPILTKDDIVAALRYSEARIDREDVVLNKDHG